MNNVNTSCVHRNVVTTHNTFNKTRNCRYRMSSGHL